MTTNLTLAEIINNQAAKIRKLQADLAECYRLSGADPDGNEDWRLAEHAVEEVKRMRAELDGYEAREYDNQQP